MNETLAIMHKKLWDAIDRIAYMKNMSVSKLARISGLDATAFNSSKRITVNKRGELRRRFLSTESISKVLATIGLSWDDFSKIVNK